jgi:hypothetical protein
MTKALRVASFAAVATFVMLSEVFAQHIIIQAVSPFLKNSTGYTSTVDGGKNFISTGLDVVAKGTRVYFAFDTTGLGSAPTSWAWTLTTSPAGSTAALDTANKNNAAFIADVVGSYTVSVVVGGKTYTQNIFADVFKGTPIDAKCEFCHVNPVKQKFDSWKTTVHATIFKNGITGNLENNAAYGYKGAYGLSCIKCHTTGWESSTNNGNFGYLAHTTNFTNGGVTASFDSTWWRGLTFGDGDYWIAPNDQTLWNNLPAALKGTAMIGCEQCHGPATTHASTGDITKIDKSLDAGVCNQCHAASASKHRIGIDWAASVHAALPNGSHTAQTGCYPCHSGAAFVKWVNNPASPGYDTTGQAAGKPVDGNVPISCAVCHEPHGNSNTAYLRKVTVDSLMNGYKITGGGLGQLCMNCHRGRSDVAKKVTNTAPSYGYSARFYNHNSPQADMFWGQNGYEFGQTITKTSTHQNVEDACVTCHMPPTKTNNMIVNHSFSMDTAGVAACVSCHAGATSIAGIKASSDYDGDGAVEGFQDEFDGLMAKLKAYLPIDPATNDVAQGPLATAVDSAKWKGKKNIVAGVWNYWFLAKDLSHGVHNPKYSVGLLKATLSQMTGVTQLGGDVAPSTFELTQNYPNPFNPSTQIGFALPKASNVRVNIYDITGKLVRSLVNDSYAAGTYSATWDGQNLNGQQVTSGVYIYRIEAGSFTATKKMLMLK